MRSIKALMDLKGRVALITGATGKIGQELAITIAELGANLILVDLPGSDFSKVQNRVLHQYDVSIKTIACNLENEKSRQHLIDHINKNEKYLNIIINNAAFVGESDLEGWVTDFESQEISTYQTGVLKRETCIFIF